MSTADDSLYWACFDGSKRQIVILANQNNVNYVHPRFGDTPLHLACKLGWLDIVEMLIDVYGCDPNVVTKNKLSLLHFACQYGHIDIVKLLIEKYGCDPNVVTESNGSLLQYACLYGHIDIVKLLIEKYSCDPNMVTKSNESLLYCAYQYGQIKIVMLLIEKYGCDPNAVTESGESLLHYACRCGHIGVIKVLIEKCGCDPNVTTKSNQTLLHYACQYHGNIDFIKYLINKQHLNPLIRDSINQSEPLDYAANNNKYSIAVYLCRHISSNEMLSPNRIKTTINLIKYIIRTNSMVYDNIEDRMWKTANGDNILQLVGSSKMHIAHMPSAVILMSISHNASYIIEYFKPDLRTANGDTILQLVCQSETLTTVIPDCRTADGHTLLQLILRSEMSILRISSQMLAKLLSNSRKISIDEIKNINPNWKTADEAHFPHVLCLSNIENNIVIELMQYYILKNGWNPDTPDGKGNTVLHIACQTNKFAVVSYLMDQAQCNPNIRNGEGSLPVDMTTNLEVIKYLCQHDRVDVFSNTISKWMINVWLIDKAAMLCIIKLLVDNLKYETKDGSTLLHVVCISIALRDKKSLVEYLLVERQCDPNCLDNKGRMPLQLTSNLEIMKALVEHGAKMTADVVFKIISSIQIIEFRAIELLTLSSRNRTLLWHPTDLNKNGKTALDLAYTLDKPSIVNYLLTDGKYHANDLFNSLLELTTNLNVAKLLIERGARVTPELVLKFEDIVASPKKYDYIKLMLTTWNPNDRDSEGYTALHLACKADRPTTVNLLLSVAHSDPNVKSKSEEAPIQLTTDLKIMKILVEHGAQMTTDVVFKLISMHSSDFRVPELFELSITKGSMLWNPNDLNIDGYTALHLACKISSCDIVDYLLSVAHCDPNVSSKNNEVPIQLTSNFRIMKKLVEHGAQMTTDVIFKLISMHSSDSNVSELTELSTTKGTMLRNPNDVNSDGYTALHFACKADSFAIVNYLLSVAHCDPNIRSKNEEVCLPLQLTTNTEIIKDLIRHGAKTQIMYESHENPLRTSKPVQPPAKIFVVGNPSVGKSTLTAALKTERIGILGWLFTSGRVSGVDKSTVGIVPHDVESDTLGRVTLYDFAGHREFYSGHAAILQTAIQSIPPIFILVINLCEDKDDIIKSVLYWASFLENQCASVSCKPHIIIVGSHADALKGVNPEVKIKMITDSLDRYINIFANMEYIGVIAMNCQYHESSGMNELRHLLIKSCEQLRIQEPITFNAHCFLVYLIDTFIDLPAVTIKTISEKIENQQTEEGGTVLEFLPKSIEALYKICLELNDRGHILLLKDRIAAENSYVVIDKTFLLTEISGTVFAPEGFMQYTQLSTNSGVVPRSKLADSFPGKDLNIVMGFLNHLEFCHEIVDQALHQLISKEYSQTYDDEEHYYLFPGLVSVNAEKSVWKTESHFEHNFGWILKCVNDEQFFSLRFLQVLLLRLAFSFALKVSSSDHTFGIHRKCSIWKNGIFWGRNFNMDVLVEVTDNKSVTLIARFKKINLLKCINQRSEVIVTILECVKQFCPRVATVESFIDSSSALQYPLVLNSDRTLCSVRDLSEALVSSCECPSVVLSDSGKSLPAERFLSYESYSEIEPQLLQVLWDKDNESKIVSDTFLSRFVKKSSKKLHWFVNIFNESANVPSSKDDLFHELIKWRESDDKKTYKDFRYKLDQCSIFAGRNILNIAEYECEASSKEEELQKLLDGDQTPKLRVKGNAPQLYELQLLEFDDGRELRIMETVAPKWKKVATAIGFNKERIEAIEEDEHYKQEKATFEMFGRWLKGEHNLKPATWDTLVQCLKEANLLDIAKTLMDAQIDDDSDGTKTTCTHKEVKMSRNVTEEILINTECDSEVLQNNHGDSGPLPILNTAALEALQDRRGGKVKIIESIGSEWEEVAKALDMGQEDIDMIKTRHSDHDEEACREMLATWLEGNNGEVSWTALTQALIDTGLPQLADSLKDVLNL